MTRSPENEGLESHTLEYLEDKYGSISRVPRRVFPVLNSLKINVARSLNEICYGQLRMGPFEELRQLVLLNLPVLTHLWIVPTEFECLPNLESMYISDCDMMRDIVMQNEESGDGEATNKIVLPQVKTIHPDNLPSLITFFPAPCTVGCPSLRTLVLCRPKMRTFIPLFAAAGSGTAINHENLQFPTHIFNEKVRTGRKIHATVMFLHTLFQTHILNSRAIFLVMLLNNVKGVNIYGHDSN